ncbi:MAG: CRTAC1 family protein [Planctomycetaceae bacterium]
MTVDEAETVIPWLEDVTEKSGICFRHNPGDLSACEMTSIMGSGVAVVDFDLDGMNDLYFVNGAVQPNEYREDQLLRQFPPGVFTETSPPELAKSPGFGMGAWWGDYDADGFPDLYLTNAGVNQLLHNCGDGTLKLVAGELQRDPAVWSTAATWADSNSDGLLDLVVVNYVDYVPGQYCEGADGKRDFCGPSTYEGTVDRLWINLGFDSENGLFRDETVQSQLGDVVGKGLGVVADDFNQDGLIDFYIANDMEPNRLWLQQENGEFHDEAVLRGVARNGFGHSEASMGVLTSDWNEDGHPDLLLAHLTGETNTLFLSDSGGFWSDQSSSSRLGPSSLPDTSFGLCQGDLDCDGIPELLVANGGVRRVSSENYGDEPLAAYIQANRMYSRDKTSLTFVDSSRLGGEFSTQLEASRGLVAADLNRDGHLEVIVSNCAGDAHVFESTAGAGNNWVAFRLFDSSSKGNREAIGAVLRMRSSRGERIHRINPYQGYLSQQDIWCHLGVAGDVEFQSIEVTWADGVRESFPGGATNTCWALVRGGRLVRVPVGACDQSEDFK